MMSDREKVIAWLADEELYYRDHGDTHNSLMACNAISLLKEQEAVEPRVSNAEQRCGHCNKVIEMDGWQFCPWCGKRIDWKGW
jgi:hypothetical protein